MTTSDLDLVGSPEIAARLGVKLATVWQWGQRDLLPEPPWRISGRPLWEWGAIEAWAIDTGRLSSAPDGQSVSG